MPAQRNPPNARHFLLCQAVALSTCWAQALMPEAPAVGSGLLQSLYPAKPAPLADPQLDAMSALQLVQTPQMFLQPTAMSMPSPMAMMQMPSAMPDTNLRRTAQTMQPMMQPMQPAMGQMPAFQPPPVQSPQMFGQMPQMAMPYQQMQPMGYQQLQTGNWAQEQAAMQQQFMAMKQELQELKQQEAKQAKDLELKTAEANVADKKVEEVEKKMKDANVAAAQLQEREQKVEDQAISAVRTAKAQVSQAQKEVQQMQEELRQAQADAIQARAAQAAAEEQVAKAEMMQAAQAQTDINKDMLSALSSVKRTQPAFEVGTPQ
mmetsp:Transcript_13792/g.25856  ORF Transcript_13792/g.25856 Transcript_13792/m.25856 type:complete len:319 (+) Transcript_13792:97-1053(+)